MPPRRPRANVNVSALQLDTNLAGHGRAARCGGTGCTPRRLSIEITESALMKDPTAAARGAAAPARPRASASPSTTSAPATRRWPTCGACRSTASRSTAPSSPSSADRATPRSPPRSSRWPAALGLRTVAEGVETAEQAEQLARLGATYLQGFGLAAPLTGADAGRLVRRPARATPDRRRRDRARRPCPGPCPRPRPDLRPGAGAGQHRHDVRAAPGGRADRVAGQLRRAQRRGAVPDPGLRRRARRPGDEAVQLRLLRHARPGRPRCSSR